MSESNGHPDHKTSFGGMRWTDIANILSVMLTAIATMLGAYAAIRANESAETLAALQAVSQFNTAINQYSRSGACSVMLVRTYDRGKLSLLLNRAEFSFDANADNLDAATRCLERKIASGERVDVPAEQSRSIYQNIFNAFNGYEGILLYWNLHTKNENIICLEVFPGFDKYVRPLLKEMGELTANDEAKRLLAGYPALIAFSRVQGCGQAAAVRPAAL
jgi:hypothetical protein